MYIHMFNTFNIEDWKIINNTASSNFCFQKFNIIKKVLLPNDKEISLKYIPFTTNIIDNFIKIKVC